MRGVSRRTIAITGIITFCSLLIAGLFHDNRVFADDSKKFVRDPNITRLGICPPFHLRDENDAIINPVQGLNAGAPYSPRMTCGKCHDYDKIVQGYHFQQGKDEKPTAVQGARVGWALSPGNYGGNWCNPTPLYPYLSAKKNSGPRAMDMTSFDFVVKCGQCHPGGGPLEFDRSGKRYDRFMSGPENNLVSGGDNDFDGDYHKSKWDRSGTVEADCLLCHFAKYNHSERNKQLSKMNFKWAATAGTGLAKVEGSVADGAMPFTAYDKSLFMPDGKIELGIIKQPRNRACLACHAQPGYKKRGEDYNEKTDVHLRAGLRCTDCHPAGTSASDKRINERYDHNLGKGDDPGGLVRNDLDNTVVTCNECHDTGKLGAPVALHRGLPPRHLEKISCQACHIPERTVRAAQVIASDVLYQGKRVPGKGKQIWTFYGPDMKNYNHYGYLTMMGYEDKPRFRYQPSYASYKDMIYPVNRIHSIWPAIETPGKPGLMQPKAGDIHKMWADHEKDAATYPELLKIRDDNNDGVPEVNRPEEIDALIRSVTEMLAKTGYSLEGKRVLWVMNDRAYSTGTEYRLIPKEEWEASPFGNTHKYSHGVMAARSAIGASGCAQCHSFGAAFFYNKSVVYPFDRNAMPVKTTNAKIMGYSSFSLGLMNVLQGIIKPGGFWAVLILVVALLLHFITIGPKEIKDKTDDTKVLRFTTRERVIHYTAGVSFLALAVSGFTALYGSSITMETIGSLHIFHLVIGIVFIASGFLVVLAWKKDAKIEDHDRDWLKKLGGYFGHRGKLEAGRFNAGQKLFFWFAGAAVSILALSGIVISLSDNGNLRMALHVVHDVTAIMLVLAIITHTYLGIMANPTALTAIIRGTVPRDWLKEHHPKWIDE